MISHEYRCIFIHIPKCAGTSIEHALGHFSSYGGPGGQDHRSIRMLERPLAISRIIANRGNATELLRRIAFTIYKQPNPNNKFTVSKKQFNNYFKFCFVRNPWARAYSWYKNVMRDDNHKKRLNITEDLSLIQFLKSFAGKGALRPQTHWIEAYDGSIPLDYIGRFESLEKDFKEVCTRMQGPCIELPHKIKGSNEDYKGKYDSTSRDIISNVYEKEIRLYEYAFDQ